jgi:hypothetical protein
MTDAMTSQYIALSSWDTLYKGFEYFKELGACRLDTNVCLKKAKLSEQEFHPHPLHNFHHPRTFSWTSNPSAASQWKTPTSLIMSSLWAGGGGLFFMNVAGLFVCKAAT